jgi:hypothetical protein
LAIAKGKSTLPAAARRCFFFAIVRAPKRISKYKNIGRPGSQTAIAQQPLPPVGQPGPPRMNLSTGFPGCAVDREPTIMQVPHSLAPDDVMMLT